MRSQSKYERTGHQEQEDFVFCSKDGFPLSPDVLRKDVLYPILDRLRIPRSSGAPFHPKSPVLKVATIASLPVPLTNQWVHTASSNVYDILRGIALPGDRFFG